ncbi:MAG TPA: ATP-binding protein [Desulfosarcina sp.]|nr:ATP-binding protein [Desulfosarcina sp.]
MDRNATTNRRSGMQTSPWIILGSTVILLIVVIVFAVQNSQREKQYMSQLLSAKGAALIRAVEAGARAGMMGMMWGGEQIQRLLEETGRLPDVLYMAVVDRSGAIVAHSDPSKIGGPFRRGGKLVHLGPDLKENWELVDLDSGKRSFEVHRHFKPLAADRAGAYGHMQGMMQRHGMGGAAADDWFAPQRRERLLIVVGLDIDPFEAAIREDIRTSVVMSAVILLTGFAGFVSLFWMNSYRQAQRSLQDTSAFADELVTHLPVGLIATDPAGRITFFNAAAETITGLTAAAVQGGKAERLLPAQLCGLKQSLEQGETIAERETECTFGDGQSVPLSISAARIVNEIGELVGNVLILRDLREVRRLEAEVRRQDKLAALGKLAAGVAHEIRNPLSSIKGMTSFFAAQFPEGSEAKAAAGVMNREVDRLNRAISELLDFARPTDLKRRPTDIVLLLERSVQLVGQDAANQNVRIDLALAEDICPVHVDPDRLNQCLLNLYLNAIQAMGGGGVLRVSCEAADDRRVFIRIGDTGPGIAAEHLGRIFDPYFTTKNKGTGLGLAVVHKIIEAHQAHLDVESIPGKGTTMTIQLDCTPATV